MPIPDLETSYRLHDFLTGEQAIEEFPALTERHLKSLRASGRIDYARIAGRACYRWIDLYNYVESRVVVR